VRVFLTKTRDSHWDSHYYYYYYYYYYYWDSHGDTGTGHWDSHLLSRASPAVPSRLGKVSSTTPAAERPDRRGECERPGR
jgi:hypothetical protein